MITKTPGSMIAKSDTLSRFSDLIVTDATLMKLHDMLAKTFPGVRTNHSPSSMKMHAVLSVTGRGKSSIRLTAGRRHDGPVFTVGSWVRDKLLIFDLAYYRYQLFSCIARNRGFFVSRLKSCSNLQIISQNRQWRGRSIDLVGRSVQGVAGSLKRETVDVMVNVDFRKRGYGGHRRKATQTLRVVGIRNRSDGGYHFFITNVPLDRLSAEDIAQVYAARWEIELLFRELKSQYRLEDLPSRRRHVVEALVYASVLTLVASRTLLAEIQRAMAILPDDIPRQRWAILFNSIAQELLVIMTRSPSETAQHVRLLSQMLFTEAINPNRNRRGLIPAIESGTHYYELRTR